jgi:hypothetical protein
MFLTSRLGTFAVHSEWQLKLKLFSVCLSFQTLLCIKQQREPPVGFQNECNWKSVTTCIQRLKFGKKIEHVAGRLISNSKRTSLEFFPHNCYFLDKNVIAQSSKTDFILPPVLLCYTCWCLNHICADSDVRRVLFQNCSLNCVKCVPAIRGGHSLLPSKGQ